MKKFLAIVVCKLGRAVGKLVGKGSSMPGKFALKLLPGHPARVQLPEHIIAVTGSNGKTSTVEMIAAILRAAGKTVVYNEEGSNQIEGVTTLVLTHADLTGRVRADVLLIESDERYAAQSFRYFHPHGVRHHQSLPGPADPERPPGVGVRRHPAGHPPGDGAAPQRRRSPVQLLCPGP